MYQRRALYLFSFLFLFQCSLVALAQPTPVSEEFQVNTNTGRSQGNPRAAVSSLGDFVVAWDSTGTPDGYGVFSRFLGASGGPLGEEFRVQPVDGEIMFRPDVAMGSANEALIVWQARSALDGINFDLFGQRFTPDGSAAGSRFQINETVISPLSSYNLLGGRVAMSDSEQFVVVWETTTDRNDPETANIFARLFDPAGNPLAGEFMVPTTAAGIQVSASVAMDPSGNFVVAWQELQGDLEDDFVPIDFFVRLFDADGDPTSEDIFIGSTSSGISRSEVGVAFGPDGGFALAWTDGSITGGDSFDVEARRFDSTGNPLGESFLVSSFVTGLQALPALDFDSQGNLMVTWTELSSGMGRDDEGLGVVVRQFTPTGIPLGEEILVNTFTTGDQGLSRLVTGTDGRFLVTWQSDGHDATSGTILSRLFQPGTGADPALVGHWPLDEGMGSVAANSAGNGLDGTLERGTGWTDGQQGSAGFFDGIDDLTRIADFANSPVDVTNALTIALWVRPDGLDGSHQVLVSKDESYELEIGKLGTKTWDLRFNNEVVREASTPVQEGVWQHLAMTWDGSEVCSFYNGLLDGCSPFATLLVPNDRDLGLGARPSGVLEGGPVFHFAGALDEVYIFNRVFTEDEIATLVLSEINDLEPPVRSDLQPALSLPAGSTSATLSLDTDEEAECRWDVTAGQGFGAMANAFATTGGTEHSAAVSVSDSTFQFYVRCRDSLGNTNGEDATIVFGVGASDVCGDLISHWDLEEGSGCVAADSFGPNFGDLGPDCPTNAPEWVAGRSGMGQALAYGGSTDRVEVPDPSGFSSLSGITVAAWIRHSAAGTWRSIVDHRELDNDGYDLFVNPDSRLFLRVNDLVLTGDTVVADGQWHHVVGTYDGSELRLYVDGLLDKSQPVAATTIEVTSSLFLGRRWNNDQTPFAGELDEVTVLGRGLSAVEVVDLYGGGIEACLP